MANYNFELSKTSFKEDEIAKGQEYKRRHPRPEDITFDRLEVIAEAPLVEPWSLLPRDPDVETMKSMRLRWGRAWDSDADMQNAVLSFKNQQNALTCDFIASSRVEQRLPYATNGWYQNSNYVVVFVKTPPEQATRSSAKIVGKTRERGFGTLCTKFPPPLRTQVDSAFETGSGIDTQQLCSMWAYGCRVVDNSMPERDRESIPQQPVQYEKLETDEILSQAVGGDKNVPNQHKLCPRCHKLKGCVDRYYSNRLQHAPIGPLLLYAMQKAQWWRSAWLSTDHHHGITVDDDSRAYEAVRGGHLPPWHVPVLRMRDNKFAKPTGFLPDKQFQFSLGRRMNFNDQREWQTFINGYYDVEFINIVSSSAVSRTPEYIMNNYTVNSCAAPKSVFRCGEWGNKQRQTSTALIYSAAALRWVS